MKKGNTIILWVISISAWIIKIVELKNIFVTIVFGSTQTELAVAE